MVSAPSKTELLVIGPVLDSMLSVLAQRYQLHYWWKIENKTDFLEEHAAHIKGLVTSGRFGADAALIKSLPNLEGIFSFGVGVDPIDIAAATAQGVIVTNTPKVLDNCVADTALALMLAVARRIPEADQFVRRGQWLQTGFGLGRKVSHQRCGIIGLGNIGMQVAKRAAAFDMTIHYQNLEPRQDVPADFIYEKNIIDLAHHSDFLVICVPGGKSTYHLINEQVLQALGKDGFLINVSRGTVVDEDALIHALEHQVIAGAALDVFEFEPKVPPALFEMNNVVLTPHLASGTVETRQAMSDLVIQNVDGWFLNHHQVLTPVNRIEKN